MEHILERLGAGETVDDLLAAHPGLTREGIRAALDYAADVLKTSAVAARARYRSSESASAPPSSGSADTRNQLSNVSSPTVSTTR